ncbi:MAG: hypothetical protein A3F67_08045 [Verrucomicrobia bacterium RIFCSPHIGHO2_12_FULL_41_10]|nr:MAG: hypothetical protein A3F67_08045 [Verrucomicrobia bacterium RIFCSPHIGHO2_12_FULL_41_10]
MATRKTHGAFIAEVAVKAPNIEVLGTYVNNKTKLKVRGVCGHEWDILPTNFLSQGAGMKCLACSPTIKSHKTFAAEVAVKAPGLEILGTYINNRTRLPVKGMCGHEWSIQPNHLLSQGWGAKCPTCLTGNTKPHKTFVAEVFEINPHLEILGTYINNKTRLLVKGICGHEWSIQPHDFCYKGSGSRCPTCSPTGTSKGERALADFIEKHAKVSRNTRILGGKEIDILVPDYNLAIEYNGEYWHSKKDKNYHLDKTLAAKAQGITLIHIFEHEWLQKQEIVKSRIMSMLSKSYSVGARACILKEIPFPKEFLNDNHIQGAGTASKHNIGLYFEGFLVAVMTFSKPRFNHNYEYELVRYCSITGITVIGGAGKLLKYFLKTYSPKNNNIVSYSDKRWSTGNLYKQLGFSYLRTSLPNYSYYKGNEIISRYKAMKHKLADLVPYHYKPELTETEIMTNAGYLKVYDCGNDVWVK